MTNTAAAHICCPRNILRDLRETEEAEGIAIKTQSQWAALVGTKTPFNDKSIEYWTGKTREGVPTIEAQWGKILRLGEGETIAPFSRRSDRAAVFSCLTDPDTVATKYNNGETSPE